MLTMRRLLRTLRGTLPRLPAMHRLRWRVTSREKLFSQVYETAGWASAESGSGTGSELRATVDIRQNLPEVLTRLEARSLLDAPCGDLNWMSQIELPVDEYYGVDIVPSVIAANERQHGAGNRTFAVADLTRDELPQADAILCRDCLVHVSFQDAALILDNFRSTGANWLLTNTYSEVESNRNQFTGRNWRRLNLTRPPFDFPEPVESFPDGGDVDPSRIGVWPLQELRLPEPHGTRR